MIVRVVYALGRNTKWRHIGAAQQHENNNKNSTKWRHNIWLQLHYVHDDVDDCDDIIEDVSLRPLCMKLPSWLLLLSAERKCEKKKRK
jgi:hypothetical protein